MSVVVLIIISVMVGGIAAIFDKMALKDGSPIIGLTLRALTVIIMLVGAVIFTGKTRELISCVQNDSRSALFFAISGLLAGFIGMITYYGALKQAPASVVVPLSSTYPLVTAILGMVLLKESFSFERLIGVLLIVIGIYLVQSKI